MNLKLVQNIMTAVGVLGLILIIYGGFVFVTGIGSDSEFANNGIIQVLFGLVLLGVSISILKIASYMEKQEVYFNNRIRSLEKHIDGLKEKIDQLLDSGEKE